MGLRPPAGHQTVIWSLQAEPSRERSANLLEAGLQQDAPCRHETPITATVPVRTNRGDNWVRRDTDVLSKGISTCGRPVSLWRHDTASVTMAMADRER